MAWKIDQNRPIYIQLMEILESRIISGVYKSGEKLPSVRTLATEASVNPNTMQKAMSELDRTGVIHSNRTSGYFVTENLDTINTLREEASKNIIEVFFMNMSSLGFSDDEIKTRLRHYIDNYKKV